MSDTKHTPGPWSFRECDSVVMIEAGSDSIAATNSKTYWQRFDDADVANARLIAAAPDLLAALKSAERWLGGILSETEDGVEAEVRNVHSAAWNAIDSMRAAIAKAEGRS